jgi:hypothetical protein
MDISHSLLGLEVAVNTQALDAAAAVNGYQPLTAWCAQVLEGTHDPGSPLYRLCGQAEVLYHIFSFWAEVLVYLGGTLQPKPSHTIVANSSHTVSRFCMQAVSWFSNRHCTPVLTTLSSSLHTYGHCALIHSRCALIVTI